MQNERFPSCVSPLHSLWRRLRSEAAYAVVLSIACILVSAYEAHLFQMYVLPEVAPLVASHGDTLALPIRLLIIAGRTISPWLPALLPALVLAGLWIGLFWRPYSPLGPALVLTVAVGLTLLIQSIFLIALFQTTAYLAPLSSL